MQISKPNVKLSEVTAAISGRSAVSQVKSVQRGVSTMTVSSSLSVTVAAVTMGKSWVNICGVRPVVAGGSNNDLFVRASLASATSISFEKVSSSVDVVVSWELHESV